MTLSLFVRTTRLDPQSRQLKHPHSISKHDHTVPGASSIFPQSPRGIHFKALLPLAPPSAHPHHSADLLLHLCLCPPVATLPSRTSQSCSSSGQRTEQESPDSSTHCLQDGLCKGSRVQHFSALRPVLASHSSGLQEHISTGHGSNLKFILVRHPSPFDTRGMLVSGCKMPSF